MEFPVSKKTLVPVVGISERAPHVLEALDEKFDSVSTKMTPGSVIYGGALVSVLAGLRIEGDLDVAVSGEQFMEVAQNFSSSTKWLQVDGQRVPEREAGSRGPGLKISGAYASTTPSSPYGDGSKGMPIGRVATFQNVSGGLVQVIASSKQTGNPLTDALEIVSKVDMIFCAVAIDLEGKIYEMMDGALQDCRDRRMRLGSVDPRLDPRILKARISKYARRGWHLDIDVDKAIRAIRKAQARVEGKGGTTENSADIYRQYMLLHQTSRHGMGILIPKNLCENFGARFIKDLAENATSTATMLAMFTPSRHILHSIDEPWNVKDVQHVLNAVAEGMAQKGR